MTERVDRDTGLEPTGTETKCLSRLEPGVPIHILFPDPPRLTVGTRQSSYHGWVLQRPQYDASKHAICFVPVVLWKILSENE